MNINQRIKKIREMFFADRNILFANALGISRQYANNLVVDGTSVGDSMLDLILEKAPRINPVWLKMGKGEMLLSEIESPVIYNDSKLEELQRENEMLKRENDSLKRELNIKDQLIASLEDQVAGAKELASTYKELAKKGNPIAK